MNNPPAFPHGDPTHGGELGMTLRDYFAAKAMQGMISINSETPHDYVAIDAYSYADAMLRTREE
jgi:hypothetical protein